MKILRLKNKEQPLTVDDHHHRGAEAVTPTNARNATSTSASSALSKVPCNLGKKPKHQISFENLSMKDFQLIKDLGSGSYGIVSLVNLHGSLFALKQVNK